MDYWTYTMDGVANDSEYETIGEAIAGAEEALHYKCLEDDSISNLVAPVVVSRTRRSLPGFKAEVESYYSSVSFNRFEYAQKEPHPETYSMATYIMETYI